MILIQDLEIDDIVTGNVKANLELLQWLKMLFRMHYNGQEYNAIAVREQVRQTRLQRSRRSSSRTGTTHCHNEGDANAKTAGSTSVAAAAMMNNDIKHRETSSTETNFGDAEMPGHNDNNHSAIPYVYANL